MHYEIGLKIMKLKNQRGKKKTSCIRFFLICFHFTELLAYTRIRVSSFFEADNVRNWGSEI